MLTHEFNVLMIHQGHIAEASGPTRAKPLCWGASCIKWPGIEILVEQSTGIFHGNSWDLVGFFMGSSGIWWNRSWDLVEFHGIFQDIFAM